MFKKNTVIEYESSVEIYPNILIPAKSRIPQWYKKITKFKNNTPVIINEGFQNSLKTCVPFLDALSSGYLILLPFDIYVKDNDGQPYLTWMEVEGTLPPKWRNEISDENVVPTGHYPMEYVWQPNVAFKVPHGFSLLFTHPLNRHDLPFTTLSAIVDGNFVISSTGNVPFYIKKGFEGIISQGTPIAQIIPFRQEKWKSKIKKGLVKEGINNVKRSQSVINGWYKNAIWTKKDYS